MTSQGSNQIPRNIPEAAKIAAGENIGVLDAGNFSGRYFSYVAAFGIGTSVSYATDQKQKNRWGMLAYAANAMKELDLAHIRSACRDMVIKTEDTILTGKFLFGSISNSRSIAGMKNLVAKDVELDDGVLDGLFIRMPRSVREYEQLQSSLITRNFDAGCMYFIRAERFEISLTPQCGHWMEKTVASILKLRSLLKSRRCILRCRRRYDNASK